MSEPIFTKPSKPDRLHHLDNLRTFAMMFGIFVHTNHIGDFGILNSVVHISNLWRMATFFMVSGFFTAMMLQRRTPTVYLRDRAYSLLIPLTFGLIVLNPITLPLIDQYFSGTELGHGSYLLHLWFLVSLAAYSTLAALMCRPLERFLKHYEGRSLDPQVAALVASLVIVVFSIVLRQTDLPFVINATIKNAPYFAIGILLFYFPKMLNKIEVRPCWMLVLIAIVSLCISWLEIYRGPAWGVIDDFAGAATRFASAFSLLALFSRFFRATSVLWKAGIDSIYSLYLLHYLTIYAICAAFSLRYGDVTWLGFLIISTVIIVGGILFQHFIINRSNILLALLSGKVCHHDWKALSYPVKHQMPDAFPDHHYEVVNQLQKCSKCNRERKKVS